MERTRDGEADTGSAGADENPCHVSILGKGDVTGNTRRRSRTARTAPGDSIMRAMHLSLSAAVLALLPLAGASIAATPGPATVPETFKTFDIPFDKLPGGRMNAKGELDPTSSPEDAHKGAFV